MNFLDVEIVSREGDSARIHSDLVSEITVPAWREGVPFSGRATLGIRPQDLRTVDTGGILQGNVAIAERLGIETVVDITLKDGSRLLVSLPEDRVFEPGQPVELGFDPARAHLFALDAEATRNAA